MHDRTLWLNALHLGGNIGDVQEAEGVCHAYARQGLQHNGALGTLGTERGDWGQTRDWWLCLFGDGPREVVDCLDLSVNHLTPTKEIHRVGLDG